jgi:pimeloyl-ACP methyl ester carboxylesterase
MPDDVVLRFLQASTEDRLEMVRNGDGSDDLRLCLGEAAFEEYRGLARKTSRHLGIHAPRNVVFIPGVMGSLLMSRGLGGIWWVDVRTRQHIDDLRLAPDGQSDAVRDHDVVAVTSDPSYEPFLAALLERDDLGHVTFSYDWRKPLAASARALVDLVLRLYEQGGREPIHVVAHSMGGLVARTALALHGDELTPALGRIVFVGTPHYGSPAIAGYLKNHLWGFDLMAVLGTFLTRATFQSLWGVLELLPAPRGVYPGTRSNDPARWRSPSAGDPYEHPCANFDLYDAAAWDLRPDDPADTARLQRVLDGAAAQHRRLYDAHRALPQALRDRMLVIAGVGYQTLFRMAYRSRLFELWDQMERTQSRLPGDPHRDGDGRVPVASAALENVGIRYVKGVHGGLTNIAAVYTDVFRWLTDETLQLPDTPEGAFDGHLAGPERSDAPTLDGSARAARVGDDPGCLHAAAPDAAAMAAFQAQLDAGTLAEFNRVRIL